MKPAVVLFVLVGVVAGADAQFTGCFPYASLQLKGESYLVYSCGLTGDAAAKALILDVFANAESPGTRQADVFLGVWGWNQCHNKQGAVPCVIVYGSCRRCREGVEHQALMSKLQNPGFAPTASTKVSDLLPLPPASAPTPAPTNNAPMSRPLILIVLMPIVVMLA